jgi:hypothetical protein
MRKTSPHIAFIIAFSLTISLVVQVSIVHAADLVSLPAGCKQPDPSNLALDSSRSLEGINIGGQGQVCNVNPGETVSGSLTYQIYSGAGNPSEINQGFLIMSWTPTWPASAGYYISIWDDISGVYPGVTKTASFSFTAPSSQGTYYLYWCGGAEYSMSDAVARYKNPLNAPAHAKIIVGQNTASSQQEKTIFSDDFESYALGAFPSIGGWELVFNGKGTAYQTISNAYYVSPTKSFRLWGQPDWSAVAQKTFSSSSRYLGYEVSILIKTVGSGGPGRGEYFGFYNRDAATWGKWYAIVFFNEDNMNIQSEGNTMVLGTWTTGTWYHVRVILDRDAKAYDVWINGQQVGSSLGITSNDPNIINAIGLQSDHPGVEVYYDNVRVFESSSIQPSGQLVVMESARATLIVLVAITGAGILGSVIFLILAWFEMLRRRRKRLSR